MTLTIPSDDEESKDTARMIQIDCRSEYEYIFSKISSNDHTDKSYKNNTISSISQSDSLMSGAADDEIISVGEGGPTITPEIIYIQMIK